MSYDAVTGRQDTEATFRGGRLVLLTSPGLFKGRKYRAYTEFVAAKVIRIVATKPFLLTDQRLSVTSGLARAAINVGSTPGGTFVALPTVFPMNGVISPAPTPDIVISQNGTATGGTEREAFSVVPGGSPQSLSGIRYLPAGTYYVNITVTGSTAGNYSIEYEELDV